jgi:transcriptional regulator with XRE-family HTH domain
MQDIHRLRTVEEEITEMDIKELRTKIGFSQRRFSEYFGIPVGTLRNWEQGIASPPVYVFNMIYASIRRDRMINFETIKFMKLLDELAELTEEGIEPFENATEGTIRTKIFYDASQADEKGGYRIVCDSCIVDDPDCFHHDIISYMDEGSHEYKIRVLFDEDEKPYILVELWISEEVIIVEDGYWHFA